MTIALIIGAIVISAGAGLYVGIRLMVNWFIGSFDVLSGRERK